jgi:hypothetical protein
MRSDWAICGYQYDCYTDIIDLNRTRDFLTFQQTSHVQITTTTSGRMSERRVYMFTDSPFDYLKVSKQECSHHHIRKDSLADWYSQYIKDLDGYNADTRASCVGGNV